MNQTNALITKQVAGALSEQSEQAGNPAGAGMQNSEFAQIIQQVSQLKEALHNFIEQEDFPDARVVSASGVLEAHLNSYYQMVVEKENMKPGLKTF